jgi:SWI/SNF-related matrix-associated actin-dependent regulator 1 of chromatin subfamily A
MPKLTWTGARYEITGYPAFKGQFKDVGFHFDFRSKVWWTGMTHVAKLFEDIADTSAKAQLNFHDQQIALSKALSSDLTIPVPDGIDPDTGKPFAYLPFQKAGIEYALPRINTLIADEMGLGKTIQAIGVCNALPQIKNILLVCPASLLLNWGREFMKWMTRNLSGDFASSTILPNSNIVLANYEIISKLKSKILDREWDLHIYDESHLMKNPDAKRTMAVLGHEDTRDIKNCRVLEAKKKLWLTGTPILNRPVELWPMLRVADAEGLGRNFWLYAKKFCGADGDSGYRTFDGATNLDVLQERLRASIMIRRLKKDVLTELPPKRRQIIAIPAPPEVRGKVQKEINFYANNESAVLEAIAKAEIAQSEGDKESYDEAAKDLKGLHQIMFEEISKLRHDTAVAKIPFIVDYLTNTLEQVDKIVVFAHHGDVVNGIYQHFQNVASVMHQGYSIQQRQQAVDRFQKDPKCKMIIGSIGTMGVGWTLTAASHVILCELDWRPAMVTQAEDRLHRIGQKDVVNVLHIVFDQSLDANMAKRIIEKQDMIDQALG